MGQELPWPSFAPLPRIEFMTESDRFDAFLERLALSGLIERSAKEVGWKYVDLLAYRKAEPAREEAVDAARRAYGERLRAETDRRGREGWEEPVYQKGE